MQEMGEPAVGELSRVQAETRSGLPIEEALEKMAEQLDNNDFLWTVTAIAIKREVGGNLAEVLDVLSNTMRERVELRRIRRLLGGCCSSLLYSRCSPSSCPTERYR